MSKLAIGKIEGGARFQVPLDVQTQTIAVLGIRGSGKTTTGAVIVEELLERGRQVVIIDPTDVWWGLRSSASGKSAGHPVVIVGGPHGLLPLDTGDGALIADMVVEETASAVLSLRHLRKAEQRRFVCDFAEQLYHRKGEASHRTPLLVAIDECDAFIPQRVGGAEARMVGAIEDLVRRGRAAGLGVMLISQRAASINKDVLTQAELLVAHRHVSPQDRKALDLWVEAHDTAGLRDEFMTQLASLPVGTAWWWSPGWLDVFARVKVRQRSTFDSSATPKAGAKAAVPQRLAKVDLDVWRDKLQQRIEQAERDDPRKLRARITELEREAAAGTGQADVAQAVASAIEQRNREWAAAVGDLVKGVRFDLDEAATNLAATAGRLLEAFPESRRAPISPTKPRPAANLPRPASSNNGDTSINATQRKMLQVLVQRKQMGHDTTDARTLAALAGLKGSGGTFGTYLSRLRSAGLIEGERSALRILPAGEAAAGDVEALPVGRDLVEWWKANRLNATQGRMLDVIVATWPQSIDRRQLAEQLGLEATGGTFGTYLSRMRSLGLIEGSGELRASDALMEGFR